MVRNVKRETNDRAEKGRSRDASGEEIGVSGKTRDTRVLSGSLGRGTEANPPRSVPVR
jgi:hypothetical protein